MGDISNVGGSCEEATEIVIQDSDPGEQHGDRAGGLASSLHAPRLPLPTGVRRHPQTDRNL